MSFTASYVILFVILVRMPLKKAPKVISYVLWSVVAFRLMFPLSFESIFSLLPQNAAPIPHDIIYQQSPQVNSGIEAIDSFAGTLPALTAGASVNPLQIYIQIGSYIWVLGLMAFLIYSLVSVLLLKRQLKNAQLIGGNIYEAENLKTPFVLGFMRPKIYLPVGLNVEERRFILLHEQTHIKRYDHIIKPIAFTLLCIHWFNPLVWIAFMLMSMDMELSCDERVLKMIDVDTKKPYANSLLMLATERHILNGSALAFGEGNVEGRIKNVLNYKKPRFWVIAVSIIIVIAVGIGLMANPKVKGLDELKEIKSFAWEVINKDIANYELNPNVNIIDSKITRIELVETFVELANTPIDVFALEYRLLPKDLSKVVLAGGMDVDENGWLKETCSMGSPLLVVSRNDNQVELVGILWTGEITDKVRLESDIKSLLKREGIQFTSLVEEEKAFNVVQEYFNAFAKADYKTMIKFATDSHNESLIHDGDVWGMKWARAKQIEIVRDTRFLEIEDVKLVMVFDVSVDMETVARSSQYPSTQTSFYVVLIKNGNGNWRVDRYITG